jgi:hypothetical protein
MPVYGKELLATAIWILWIATLTRIVMEIIKF